MARLRYTISMEEMRLSDTAAPDELELRPMVGASARSVLSELLDRSFGLKPGERFLSDFPVWEPGLCRSVSRWGIFDGDTLVATAGVREARLKQASGGYTTFGIVGGVATDPAYQGKGLASRLLSVIDAYARVQKFSALVLWGSQHDFYRKHGFELCGEQTRFPLGILQIREEPAAFQPGYGPGIFAARRKHSCGLELTDEDQLWYSRHVNAQWVWTGTAAAVTAYVAIGRGIDLPGMIHEWGGKPAELRGLLKALQSRIPEAEILGNGALFSEWGIQAPRPPVTEFLCMAKSLDGTAPVFKLPFWLWGLDSA